MHAPHGMDISTEERPKLLSPIRLVQFTPLGARGPAMALGVRGVAKGFAAGFSSYLTKSIEINEFMNSRDPAPDCSQMACRHAAKKDKA